MKRRFKITAVTVISLLVISLSLNIVFAVGQGAEPGSDQDPIVSKSYVDAAVAQLTAKIQSLLEQNDALKNQNAALDNQIVQLTSSVTTQEQAVKALQEELKAVKASVAAGTGASGSTGSTGNAGNTGTSGGTAAKPAATIGKATVNVAVLNIRKQPNTTSAIVAKVAKGETLTLVSKSGDWYKVTTAKGATGFVMTKLVAVKK